MSYYPGNEQWQCDTLGLVNVQLHKMPSNTACNSILHTTEHNENALGSFLKIQSQNIL